ncbi:MAG: transposase [Pirellulaceae bacterium]|nr:transposase [Pirellulaceae bacterium]
MHLYDEQIPPTNNHAEQMLKPPIIGRKIVACNKTSRGARTYEVITSIGATLWQGSGNLVTWRQTIFLAPLGTFGPTEPLRDG